VLCGLGVWEVVVLRGRDSCMERIGEEFVDAN
jgi:hypothetical protein